MSMPRGTRQGGIYTLEDVRQRSYMDEATGCWIWKYGLTDGKYPSMWLGELGKRTSAGAALAFLTGRKIAKGWRFYAKCGNSLCVNPEHRSMGDHRDQMIRHRGKKKPADQVAKMRATKLLQAKLSEADVTDIRASTATLAELAEKYGIHPHYASAVRNGSRRLRKTGGAGSVFDWRP